MKANWYQMSRDERQKLKVSLREEEELRIFVKNDYLNKEENMKTKMLHVLAAIIVGLAFIACPAIAAEQKKPNIVVIMADDVGI